MKTFTKMLTRLVLMSSVIIPFSTTVNASSKVIFEQVTQKSGVNFRHEKAEFHPSIKKIMPWLTAGGSGVAVGDYNNDGLDDMYFTSSKVGAMNHLYQNQGDFQFVDVSQKVGLADVNPTKETGTSSFALWFDFDDDGWQDLFLLRFGKTALFHNQKGEKFVEVTSDAGIFRHTNALSAVAFDYDRDGDLDIYIGGYFPEKDFHNPPDSKVLFESWETARNGGRNYLFNNDGKGVFKDVTAESGLEDSGWAMAVGHGDFNNDQWQDLYIANDFGPDMIFKNKGDGSFENITDTSIGPDTKKGMNTEFGDYNNDGLLDIYVTNMTEPYLHECNMLWRNNGDETFTDVSKETNSCDTDWGWGAKFFDVDNDTDVDIYVANGFVSSGEKEYMDILMDFIFRDDIDLRDAQQWPDMEGYSMGGYERNVLFVQDNDRFESIGKEAGVDSIRDSRGVAIADFDNDGRVDIAVSNVDEAPDIYRNVSETSNSWVQLRLQGEGEKSNHAAIGARATLRIGETTQMREVVAGNGFDAQSTLRVHFGTGDAKVIEQLSILWPDGETQEFTNIPVNTIYHLKQKGELENVLSSDIAKR